eukprot:2296772-Pleurochrysis_carterae.AAC.1
MARVSTLYTAPPGTAGSMKGIRFVAVTKSPNLHCACPRGRAECGDVVCVLLRRAAMLPLIQRGVAEWACEPKQAR